MSITTPITTPGYPTVGDVVNFLTAWNVLRNPVISTAQEAVIAMELQKCINEWEKKTGYMPFLVKQDASGNPVYTQRVFDAPGCENNPNRVGGYYWYGAGTTGRNNKLWVDDGFTDCTQILYNVTALYSGSPMTYGQDYVFYPANAKAQGRPYNEVQFFFGLLGGLPQSIVLTAKFGYCDSLPIDVAQAIIKRTAAGLMPHIEILQLGDAQTIQEKEEKIIARAGQSVSAYTALAIGWNKDWRDTMHSGNYIMQSRR